MHLHAQVVLDQLVNHLNELLASVRLPEGVERPRILRYDPAAEPMMRLVLEPVPGGPSLENLSLAAHDALVPQLESLPAVAAVRLRGMRDHELRIRPDPARMAAAKLTSERINQAITSATSSRTLGSVMDVSGAQGSRARSWVRRRAGTRYPPCRSRRLRARRRDSSPAASPRVPRPLQGLRGRSWLG